MYSSEVINYIIKFLVGEEYSKFIKYTRDLDTNAKIIIYPSCFFDEEIYGTYRSLPILPLKLIDDIPILFGDNKISVINNKVVIYADFVASTYFLISKYEEFILKDKRDKYGRFLCKYSISGVANFIERPIVDEYSDFLYKLLKNQDIIIPKKQNGFNKVYLTHDIDVPWENYSFINACKQIIRELIDNKCICISPLLNYFGSYKFNLYDTFDWLIKQDNKVKKRYDKLCDVIYFMVSTENKDIITSNYIQDRKCDSLIKKIQAQSIIGLHISYQAFLDSNKISQEKLILEHKLNEEVTICRNHFLTSYNPDSLELLISLGVTNDFTQGYADRVGFKLGTSKSVQYINPEKIKLTELVLHPLNIMDCSLYDYMNLCTEECIQKCKNIISHVKRHNGDFCFLIHNGVGKIGKHKWFKEVYEQVIDML